MGIINELIWKYLITQTYFRVQSSANCKIGNKVSIKNSNIYVCGNSSLEIHDNVNINNIRMCIADGKCIIEEDSILISDRQKLWINIEKGNMTVGHHSKICPRRIWIRWGGNLKIGNYVNINDGSELRCDESIIIGDYNQISYNVNIWDTNTHNILQYDERGNITEKYFPYFGKEIRKPKTSPVIIMNDCWIGQNATILKGSILRNEVIVGYGCIITGKEIPENTTVVNDTQLRLISHQNNYI